MILRKLNFTIKAYGLMALLSLLSFACCEQENYRLVAIQTSIIQDIDAQKIYNPGEEALITGPFYAFVSFQTEDVASLGDLNPLSSAYALSCPDPVVDNPLVKESIKLNFNRAFIFDGDTIAAGTLINDFEGFELDEPWLDVTFFAQAEFIAKAQFLDSLYTLNLEVADANGKVYQESWDMRFELN